MGDLGWGNFGVREKSGKNQSDMARVSCIMLMLSIPLTSCMIERTSEFCQHKPERT
jgi:hypothetical protein